MSQAGTITTSGGGGGGVTSITGDSGGALTGAITITGGTSGAVYAGSGGNTLTTSFSFLAIPNTSGVGSVGQITFGGSRFISNFGSSNIFIGQGCGNTTTAGQNNTFVGTNSGVTLTTGSNNSCIGENVFTGLTSGNDNTALGDTALSSVSTGNSNTCVGSQAGQLIATGSNNTIVGTSSADSLLNASNNIFMGFFSASSLTGTESSNIIIGNVGTIGDNNTIRLGTSGAGAGQQNKCFMAGIRGITTGVNDAVAVLIDSAGQLGTVSSSEVYKENIKVMGADTDRLMKLRTVTFSMKSDASKSKRYGLIAEQVHESFPELVIYKDGKPETVRYHDLPVMLLNEVQKLSAEIKKLKKQLEMK